MSPLHNDHLASQSVPPLPLSSPQSGFAAEPSQSRAGINLPFQFILHKHKGEHAFHSSSFAAYHNIQSLTKLGREVSISSLELVVFPSQSSAEIPYTIDVAWSTNDVTPSIEDILCHPGAVRVTGGGPLAIGVSIIPCDFSCINRVIKHPIPYTDFPRLTFNCYLNTSAKEKGANFTKEIAVLVLRGSLSISNPACPPGSTSDLA